MNQKTLENAENPMISLKNNDSPHEKLKTFVESCVKAEAELKKYKAVDSAKSNVRVERFDKFCEEALTEAFCGDQQPFSFADKTPDPEH